MEPKPICGASPEPLREEQPTTIVDVGEACIDGDAEITNVELGEGAHNAASSNARTEFRAKAMAVGGKLQLKNVSHLKPPKTSE